MNFRSKLERALGTLSEALDTIAPAADGKWDYKPSPQHANCIYSFSLPSDQHYVNGHPPYYVRIVDGSIDFGHVETGAGDRFKVNREKDKNLAFELFPVVQYCIKTYVENVQPDFLAWSPVANNGGRQARAGIYQKLAARSFAQAGYVPYQDSTSIYVKSDDVEGAEKRRDEKQERARKAQEEDDRRWRERQEEEWRAERLRLWGDPADND